MDCQNRQDDQERVIEEFKDWLKKYYESLVC